MQESVLTELVGSTEDAKQSAREQAEKKKANAIKTKRIERAKEDFIFFCREYLPHFFYEDPAGYQKTILEILNSQAVSKKQVSELQGLIKPQYHNYFGEREELKAVVDAEPREHGKTVRGGFAYPLWCAITERRLFTLIIGASASAAEENLENIKTELEDNEKLISDFGELKGKTWRTDKIVLTNETCIMARGAGASMRGVRHRQNRPDMVIMDDILKDDAAESKTQRDKMFRWCKRVVIPLGKKIFLLWINTIFHEDDLVCRLLAEIKAGQHPNWIGLRFSCWKKDNPADGPLWEEHWSEEDLIERESDIGSSAFTTEYRNEPISEKERKFKKEWFKYFDPNEITVKKLLKRIQADDPATGAHDMSTIVSGGTDKDGIIYVWDAWGETCGESRYINQIMMKFLFFRPFKILFESVAFQKIYKRFILKESARLGVYLPITEITPKGTQKEIRILKLAPLIENGIIQFHPENCKELIEQLYNWPKHTFDDLPDSLAYLVEGMETGSAKPTGAASRFRRRAQTILDRYRS